MSELVVAAADILLGARCPGCGRPALTLCRPCGEAVRAQPRLSWPRPAPSGLRRPVPVPPVAAGDNADVLRRALLAWKEEGRFGLTEVFGHLLAASVAQLARPGRGLALVPVPTSRRSKRMRGSDLVDELARSSARLLRGVGVDARVVQALTYARSTADQAGLDSVERSANLAGAFRLRTTRGLAGRDLLVVDDILTTGSTVAEAVRVLTGAGHRPSGIAVVAATPRHAVRLP
jgi:predicted amidophosphoribosyltransferase